MRNAFEAAFVALVSAGLVLTPVASAEGKIPKKRLRDGVYTSPDGEFTVKLPQLITPGARSEERENGPAIWAVFFSDDFGNVFFVLPSDNSTAKRTLEQFTADIQVGGAVRSKETIQTALGPQVRVVGVVKDGSPVSGSTVRDGKRIEVRLDLVKTSSLFLHGTRFYEVTVGVSRIHDDQTDDMLLERAKKKLEEFLSGLVLKNP